MSYPTRPALHCSWNTKAAKSQTSKVTRSANSTPQPSWAAEDTINHLSKHLGVTFDTEMLRLALTHRSYAFEHDGLPTNERLEFLGDAVLGVLVTDYLYNTYRDEPESELAKKRASIVSTVALAHVARGLDIGRHIFLGEGEVRTHGGNKDSILADTFEALIGATYLHGGFDAAWIIVENHVIPLLDNPQIMGAGKDWKTLVQVAVDKHNLGTIRYDITGTGPDHDRTFSATLIVGDTKFATATAKTKKDAERLAAWQSLSAIENSKHA
ncbi:MAG TPA: ribonuclease III [Candidatus Yaniella excrementigallinarum]|nr:ribonuclease III [Candidatus Yaniella excrementigallinarum]